MYNSEGKSNYYSILGNRTEFNYQELEKSLKFCDEFVNYFDEYKQSNNYFLDFDDLENRQKMQFFILLFFIVNKIF